MSYTAFLDDRRIFSGSLADVAFALKEHPGALIFEDTTGKQVDVDSRGSEAEIRARLETPPRGPGRPRLGVTAREVTLMPRHWDWLAKQPGGASVALRKLVEAASRANKTARQQARDAAYRFASAMAGNAVGFEEAMRALYAGKQGAFRRHIDYWPVDVRAHLEKMTENVFADEG
jgi:hypothetical protein